MYEIHTHSHQTLCPATANYYCLAVKIAGTDMESNDGVATMAACTTLCGASPACTLAVLRSGTCVLRRNAWHGANGPTRMLVAPAGSCIKLKPTGELMGATTRGWGPGEAVPRLANA